MEGKKIRVSIADYKIARNGCKLVSYGLGSCVAVALFQPHVPVAGLAHILLPPMEMLKSGENVLKFADVSLEVMRADLIAHGVFADQVCAKVAGGASMFCESEDEENVCVGQRNLEAVFNILKSMHIPIVSQDVGGHFGRTIALDSATATLYIRSLRGGDRTI